MKSSVIVLNRDRLQELRCCVAALGQQSKRDFELVIVTNQPDVVRATIPDTARAKLVAFSDANVSAARNAGIRAAAGDVIAFCDDDAVPEPCWVQRLTAAFDKPTTGGVGGLVRGRNGVSVQWGPQEVDRCGNDWPLHGAPSIDRVVKTVGTNCAFRRSALQDVGGFDEAYQYYLDETDLDWRLKSAGWDIGFVPDAEVHHSTAAGIFRTSERVPTNLFEIGASKSYFCAQHCPQDLIRDEIDGFVRAQRARLIRAMQLGLMEPRKVGELLDGLRAGLAAGVQRSGALADIADADDTAFVPFPQGPAPAACFLSYGLAARKSGRRDARERADRGEAVTLFEHSPTALMLRVWYDPRGFWIHRGGQFGRSDRDAAPIRIRTRRQWIDAEKNRIVGQRKFS